MKRTFALVAVVGLFSGIGRLVSAQLEISSLAGLRIQEEVVAANDTNGMCPGPGEIEALGANTV
jgi:hypothetical protein